MCAGLHTRIWGSHEKSVPNFDPMRGREYPGKEVTAPRRLWLCPTGRSERDSRNRRHLNWAVKDGQWFIHFPSSSKGTVDNIWRHFWCHNGGTRGEGTVIQWIKAREAALHGTMHGIPPHKKNNPAPNINNAMVEKL